jgi:ParB-like chromosome segregation protein Spo0J
MAEGEGVGAVHNVWLIPVDKIVWHGSLRTFRDEEIAEMALSFRVHGQLQPIMVRPIEGGLFEGVFGYQRYLAARRAGLQSILCIVKPMSDDEVYEARLVENVIRKELTDGERAEWYERLVELKKKTVSEDAAIKAAADTIEAYTGVRPAERSIRKILQIWRKIGKEARKIAHRCSSKNVGIRHLDEISRVPDDATQAKLIEQVAREGWTVQKLKRKVDEILGIRRPKPVITLVEQLSRYYPVEMIDVAYEYVQEEKALIKTLREMAAALWSRLSVEEMHSLAKELQ